MQSRILGLFPGLLAHGGIQRHNRTFCKTLSAYADLRGARVDIISLHDPDGLNDPRYLTQSLSGCAGNRARFVARALAALARPYDLMIVGHVDFGSLALPFRILRPSAPLLILTYGIEVWSRLAWHKRHALRAADRICTISDYTARRMVEQQNVRPSAIQIVPVPLAPDFFGAAAEGQPGHYTRLLSVARLSAADRDKGIDRVIDALPEIRRRVADLTYVIIGDGDDRPRLERLAHERGVADIVTFAGRVSDDQLHAYLRGGDLFVLPSRKEGFGIVFVEAMAHGMPVIAGDHGGSPEVVIDRETGLLVGHGDQAALVDAISGLLLDPARRAAMGAAGRRRANSVYNYATFDASITGMLDTLLDSATWPDHDRHIWSHR